jgi:hypothetical protein
MTDQRQPEERATEGTPNPAEHSRETTAGEAHESQEELVKDSPATAVEEDSENADGEGQETKEESQKLHQTVDMRDIGPCKKHIKVPSIATISTGS